MRASQTKTFSFRSECQADVLSFYQACINAGMQVELRATQPDVFPDVEVELETCAQLHDLQEAMRSVVDGHVMLQTLRECPLAQNSLERNYNLQ